jgi:hypothetical protein
MKKNVSIVLISIFCFISITGFSSEIKTGPYLGFKGGMFTGYHINSTDIISIGGIAGYTLPFKTNRFGTAIEAEYNFGNYGGDYVSGAPGSRLHLRTFGGYCVIRTQPVNELYTKLKIGASHEVSLERISDVETSSKEVGLSLGIGAGFRAAENLNYEIEFSTTNSGVKFFSLNFHFIL